MMLFARKEVPKVVAAGQLVPGMCLGFMRDAMRRVVSSNQVPSFRESARMPA